jgi:hypothetical protein
MDGLPAWCHRWAERNRQADGMPVWLYTVTCRREGHVGRMCSVLPDRAPAPVFSRE